MIIILPRKVSNRKFCGCQKIGWRFARVLIEVISLLSARKNARIFRFCMLLIINILHIYWMYFTYHLSLLNALKSCFLGCKNIGFTLQKMMFGMPKAMLLQLETYALGFSTLIFDQINENISLNGESDL